MLHDPFPEGRFTSALPNGRASSSQSPAAAPNPGPAQLDKIPYKRMAEAALAAERVAVPLTIDSIRESIKKGPGHTHEYGGFILKKRGTKEFFFTLPVRGEEGEIDLDHLIDLKMLAGYEVVASYHTHPHTTQEEGAGASAPDIDYSRNHKIAGYVADTFSGQMVQYTGVYTGKDPDYKSGKKRYPGYQFRQTDWNIPVPHWGS
jgi:proteasome lid subunit RPN8/RPN11